MTHFVSIILFTTANKARTYFSVRARKDGRPDLHSHVEWHKKDFYASIKKGITTGPRLPAITRATALLDTVALQVVAENVSKEEADEIKARTQAALEAAGLTDVAFAPEIKL